MPADPDQFRRLLGYFATGVTVITTLDAGGRPAGMTATALSAVSLKPPLLLVCVERIADFHDPMDRAPRFAVNVLAADQEHLSRRFATTGVDRFAGVAFRPGPAGMPLLDGVVAHLLCDRWGTYVAGDHSVFFGLLTGGTAFDRLPLLHHRGGYTTLRNADWGLRMEET